MRLGTLNNLSFTQGNSVERPCSGGGRPLRVCQHSSSSRKGRGGGAGRKSPGTKAPGPDGDGTRGAGGGSGGGSGSSPAPLGDTDRPTDRGTDGRVSLAGASRRAAVGARPVSVGGSERVRGGGGGRGAAGRGAGLLRRVLRLLLAARGGGGGDGEQPLFLPFLLLHPPVLEPDLHLRLVELEGGGDLHPPGPGQVLVEMKLLLQLGELLGGEVSSDGVGLAHEAVLASLACEGTCSGK